MTETDLNQALRKARPPPTFSHRHPQPLPQPLHPQQQSSLCQPRPPPPPQLPPRQPHPPQHQLRHAQPAGSPAPHPSVAAAVKTAVPARPAHPASATQPQARKPHLPLSDLPAAPLRLPYLHQLLMMYVPLASTSAVHTTPRAAVALAVTAKRQGPARCLRKRS